MFDHVTYQVALQYKRVKAVPQPVATQSGGHAGGWPRRPVATQVGGHAGRWPRRPVATQAGGHASRWPRRGMVPLLSRYNVL